MSQPLPLLPNFGIYRVTDSVRTGQDQRYGNVRDQWTTSWEGSLWLDPLSREVNPANYAFMGLLGGLMERGWRLHHNGTIALQGILQRMEAGDLDDVTPDLHTGDPDYDYPRAGEGDLTHAEPEGSDHASSIEWHQSWDEGSDPTEHT